MVSGGDRMCFVERIVHPNLFPTGVLGHETT